MLPSFPGAKYLAPFKKVGQSFATSIPGLRNLFTPKNTNIPLYSIPESYKVTPQDTDMSAVATKLNVPLETIVSANGGAKTLPPVGSYISTGLKTYQNSERTSPPQYGQYNTGQQERPNPGRVQRDTGANGQYPPTNNPMTLWTNIQTQISAGQQPPTIPIAFGYRIINQSTGLPFTDADFAALGYMKDTSSGQYKLASAITGQGGGARPDLVAQGYTYDGYSYHAPKGQDPYSDFKTVRMGSKRGFVTPEVAYLLQRRRRMRAAEADAAALAAMNQQGNNAPETEGTTLQLRLGSG